MKKIITPRILFIIAVILFAGLSRLLPHIPNFTPIGAMALFGGAYLTDRRLSFVVPIMAMIVSDLMLELLFGAGFHATAIFVYGSIFLISVIGGFLKESRSPQKIFLASLVSSVLFFAITNFGVWMMYGGLEQTGIAGLWTTYVLGIPFFAPTAIGDLFYNTVLFGGFYLAQHKFPSLAKVHNS